MLVKIGNFRFAVKLSRAAKQISFVFAHDESAIAEQCEAFLILAVERKMPLYAGVAVGRYNDEVKTLRSRELLFWRGAFKLVGGK